MSYEQVAFAEGVVVGLVVGMSCALAAQLARAIDRESNAAEQRRRGPRGFHLTRSRDSKRPGLPASLFPTSLQRPHPRPRRQSPPWSE